MGTKISITMKSLLLITLLLAASTQVCSHRQDSEVVVDFIEGLTKDTARDVEYHRRYFRDNAYFKWHTLGTPVMEAYGVNEIVERHQGWWDLMPDLSLTIEQASSYGDGGVTVRFLAHSSKINRPSGCAYVARMVAGKIVHGDIYCDFTGVLQEAGAIPGCPKVD